VRRRLGFWAVIAFLEAGCAAHTATRQPAVGDQTDVWVAQHIVPHLLQGTSITDLSRDRLTHPELAQLPAHLQQRDQAHAAQLIDWLAERGLAPTAIVISGAIPCGAATWNGCPPSRAPPWTRPSSR
jgi:hypothetical protein